MKIPLILAALLLFIFCSTSPGTKNNNGAKDPSLVKFRDYNTVLSFFKRNDTLFCNTTNGALFYNRAQDQWLIDLKDTINGQGDKKKNFTKASPDVKWPVGYGCSEFIIQHGAWILGNHAGEATYVGQEIVDTLTRTIYKFPYEMLCDFMVDGSIIWVGSYYGISKIDTKTLARTNYYILPACKQLKNVTETHGAVFYLDFDYGLFKYNKSTKQILPIQQLNQYADKDSIKFLNALLIGNSWYIIGCPMEKYGYYLQGNACLFIYNVESGEVKKVVTRTKYLDTLLPINDFLVCSGQWQDSYEGGGLQYSGGAMTYNLKTGQLTDVTNVPILSLYQKGKGLEALCIQEFDCIMMYTKFRISTDLDLPFKCTAIEKDTLSSCSNEGDTIDFDYKKIIVRKKGFDKLAILYNRLNKQRTSVSDSALKNLLCKPVMIKVEAKKIEMGNY